MLKKNLKKVLIITFIIMICAGVGIYATYLLDASQVNCTKPDGSTVKLNVALNELYQKAPLKTGEIVTYGDEEFYVLYDSGGTTVTLFAKTNLNQAATAQANAAYDTTKCVFSSSQYWTTTNENLNVTNGYTATDVMGKVKTYAKEKNAISGRLLTYEEANSLKDTYPDMIYGRGNAQGFEYYWLGLSDPSNTFRVWCVYGEISTLSAGTFSLSGNGGARPVIEVYRSQIT